MSRIVRIARLGAGGDGVADTPQGPVYVPFALPGEEVRIDGAGSKARMAELVQASPSRQEPACRHFGECGGCSLQHLDGRAYEAWKAARLTDALRQHGIEAPLSPMLRGRPATRRRATFTARLAGRKMILGFNAAGSHRIVHVEQCPVLAGEIERALPQLRELASLAGAGERPVRIAVTATGTGLDIEMPDLGRVSERRRQDLVRFAIDCRFARLTARGEILIEPQKPVIRAGRALLSPPPGGFLQASAEAEAMMARLVAEHLATCRRIADLFAGCGAFALRLAEFASVEAIDSDQPALDCLDRAWRSTPGLRRITTARRDLFRRPLQAAEMKGLDGIVFDPPRAGAAAQAGEIARSRVGRVAAISCNPATLGRDLAILLAGGYRLCSVMPLDQFLWSPHVEAVALLVHDSGK